MSWQTLSLILASVIISAVAQTLLKHGVTPAAIGAEPSGGFVRSLIDFLQRPAVLAGLALYGAGAILWLGALARAPLSQAYPFVSLGFVLTALTGYALFGETIGPLRILGILLIVAGVVLVARS